MMMIIIHTYIYIYYPSYKWISGLYPSYKGITVYHILYPSDKWISGTYPTYTCDMI